MYTEFEFSENKFIKGCIMFVGRQEELKAIQAILDKKSGSVLVYGKRKVGKTTLVLEALKSSKDTTVYYECLKSSMQDNINGFVSVLVKTKVLPVQIGFASFQEVFQYLNTLDKTLNIIIDEYPYLKQFNKGETVDSIFQTIIDNNLTNIRLFISGSHVGMMKDLLEEKNALYGRFSLNIKLKELNYRETAVFYNDKTIYDKIAFYSVFGGSPFVNEQLDSRSDLKQNILKTVLNPLNAVYSYAENLLVSDLFGSVNAERILNIIANGKKKYGEIESKLGLTNNGLLSKQLKTLLDMDMVSKVYPINKEDDNKKVSYEMTDNLLRFWYTYVYKNKSALQMLGAEAFYDNYIEPSITTFISHRFEEIARTFFSLQVKEGKRKGIFRIGTYYYDDSATKTNGEFDVVLQRKDNFDIYETKYYSKPLSLTEMQEEEEQIRNIKGLAVGNIGFISTSGFGEVSSEYDCISGEELY